MKKKTVWLMLLALTPVIASAEASDLPADKVTSSESSEASETKDPPKDPPKFWIDTGIGGSNYRWIGGFAAITYAPFSGGMDELGPRFRIDSGYGGFYYFQNQFGPDRASAVNYCRWALLQRHHSRGLRVCKRWPERQRLHWRQLSILRPLGNRRVESDFGGAGRRRFQRRRRLSPDQILVDYGDRCVFEREYFVVFNPWGGVRSVPGCLSRSRSRDFGKRILPPYFRRRPLAWHQSWLRHP